MTDSGKLANRLHQYEDVQAVIIAKLKDLYQQCPRNFSKPIYVLAPVNQNIDGQWEQRLRQAKENQTGERITLFPYNSKSSHWIGILLAFEADEKIERAEFIDPVNQSQFSSNKLRKQFANIYPNIILRSRDLQKHNDQQQSARLTVENLIDAAKLAQFVTVKYNVTDQLHDQIICNHNAGTQLTEEQEASSLVSTVFQGKISGQTSGSILQSLEKCDALDLPMTVPRTEQLTKPYETVQKYDESKLGSYEVLKKQLERGLAEQNISTKEELEQQIAEKKQIIQSLEKEGKHTLAPKRKESLSELERLQLLVDKIEAIESLSVTKAVDDISPIKDGSLVIEKELRNMYKDFSLMPTCAERSIICLMFYISLKLADNTIVLDGSIKIPDQLETEILRELEYLQQRLKIEELEYREMCVTLNLIAVNIKEENWKYALTVLKQLFKHLYPLNMHELVRLIEKVDDAQHLIKHKDIILFLGSIGSGKSTTIHFLSGSKMIEQKVAGLNHIAPTEIKNVDLKKITTSPFARPETRYITPVTVNFKDIGGYKNENIILCDSPGFEDTSGSEVDIANGVGIMKVIRQCKSVKPVVLISYKSIRDRCDDIQGLAHMLERLVSDIKDHIITFSYIFTKCPRKEEKAVHALLCDMNNRLNETKQSDTSFMVFLKDMIKKTREGAHVLDPVNDYPSDIIDDLVQSPAIAYPDEVFQFSITEKSKSVLQEHVRKDQLSIMSATKRSEYSFVKYKLDQLRYLNRLLGQDYIGQIYHDCTRYITKHLSEEYQEGISVINRSIMNQTILNNEDIEQYQTRIEHAQLAEELRNEHLAKDAIHSNAYIQYLNHQVDIILEILQETDLDNPLVKNSLDKIKLLSKSFSDLDTKYKNACQFLIEKLETVIKSFKNSVLTHKFDKCASNLWILYKVQADLSDHVNSENIERKYVELKEYFLEYLNDSTNKFHHIFDQEKLERSDIDSLNNCVCMLESVNNTTALPPHISKEAISGIYERLLSKILDYFKEIVTKINKQFKDDNSFHTLEQYMTELDLLRTISIIELKTTPSYRSIVEKLVGYVYKSKRNIEDHLKILYRQEGKFDYDRLIKFLFGLKSAKWIDKYRSGVYSNVLNNVEWQLVQYVTTLKDSVREMNLDLDNFDKIENISKIISQINEMKVIEKIFGSMSEHINAVNCWFMRVTNDVFVIIKDTFTVESRKEQGYQTLDFNKVEKAFHYLDACKKIRILSQSDCLSVLNSLEDFIRYFSDSIETEMGNYFEQIKQYNNTNKEEMFEKARILASRLQLISEIKTKYSRIFSCFTNKKMIEHWQNELANYLTELSDEMATLSIMQRLETLSSKLPVAKALSKLDRFLESEKYMDIYYKYQSVFFSQLNDVYKQVIEAIRNTDYERIAFELATLQATGDIGEHFLIQAKRALNFGLDNLMEETKTQAIMLRNNIEIEEIKSIVKNLKRMNRAKQFVSQLLSNLDDIDNCMSEVKQLIEQRMERSLEGIEALITINNFYQAEEKIDAIAFVRNLLGHYCSKDTSRRIESLKEHLYNVVFGDLVDKYSEMDISAYVLYPPTDTFSKLEKVKNTNPIYSEALNTIKKQILAKFREELEQAKSKLPLNPSNFHIRKFESAVKFLPDMMRDALEVELRYCKDDINRLIQQTNINLHQASRHRN